jgi:hypothetical protein
MGFDPVSLAVSAGIAGFSALASKKKPKKRSTLDKKQKKLRNQYIEGLHGKGEFADLFNFDPKKASALFQESFAAPAYQNYKENIVPGITGSFRAGNLQNSSYLGNALSKAGTDVQKNLDAQLAQMLYQGQQQSIDRRLTGINNIMNQQTFAYEQPQASPLDAVLGGFAEGAGSAWGNQAAGITNKNLPKPTANAGADILSPGGIA